MRRLMMGVFAVMATMALTTSALAASSADRGRPPKPTTTTTTQPAQISTCEQSDQATLVEPGRIELTVEGSGQVSFECLWTPQDLGADIATVTITSITGAVKGNPTVFVRDDSPGDICLLESEWLDETGQPLSNPPFSASFDLAYGTGLPTGYDIDYGIWEETTYWTFTYGEDPVGTHWCAPQDPVLNSLRYDYNGSPLHFQVGFSARSGGTVVVELTP